jgi:hypothetical protein
MRDPLGLWPSPLGAPAPVGRGAGPMIIVLAVCGGLLKFTYEYLQG